jgi:hypothetical protein
VKARLKNAVPKFDGYLTRNETKKHPWTSAFATEMALHVLAYNLARVMNIMGIQPLIVVIRV